MKLETARRNFKKYGEVYGVSEKDGTPIYQIRFTSWKSAREWYNTEEYDFRERYFISQKEFEKLEDEGYTTWEEEEYYKAMY